MFIIFPVDDPFANVERFDTQELAESAAIQASYDGHVWGVARDADTSDAVELLALVYEQKVFRPVR